MQSSTTMDFNFDALYGEPDITANVFSHLPPYDLCQVELVCKDWKNIVEERLIWKKNLEQYFRSKHEWKTLLLQHNWNPEVKLAHEKHKYLFMKISSVLGPDEMTIGRQRDITNDTLVDPNTPQNKVARNI